MENKTIKFGGNSIYKNKADLEIRRSIVEDNIKRLEEIFSRTDKAEVWATELIKDTEDNIVFNVEPKKFTIKLNKKYMSDKYPNIDKKACIAVLDDGIEFYSEDKRFVDVRYDILGYFDGVSSTHMTPVSFISVFKSEKECRKYYNKMK